ncbi:CLUMA_CG008242, isoform A [Clunio marinus]|uniref:CLUMA_CG008242, isoform A n=1 Tax=Clunio marinus TaxID=568069 RepID=A0A1J1I714_9DIPT|nr:CLUMA_CG008242, isoform A [Clunio marinus]
MNCESLLLIIAEAIFGIFNVEYTLDLKGKGKGRDVGRLVGVGSEGSVGIYIITKFTEDIDVEHKIGDGNTNKVEEETTRMNRKPLKQGKRNQLENELLFFD